MTTHHTSLWPWLPLLLVAVLAGCTSAGDRLEQGVELEQAGDAPAAAQRYVQALRKDPALGEARARLAEVGPRALDVHLRRARHDRRRGDAVAAANSFLAADALLLSTRSVQVIVPVAPDYAARRRAAFDAAIARLMRDGAASWGQARWKQALGSYQQVARFEPSPTQAASAEDARMHTLIHWSEAEMAAGRYRAAIAIADQGLAAGAASNAYIDALDEIRTAAVHRATVRVVVLPITADGGSRGFAAAVNDALQAKHVDRPAPLVDAVDPARVRRALRRSGGAWRTPDPARAIRVARTLRAAFSVLPVVQDLAVQEQGGREREQQATTRRGARVSYTVSRETVTARASASYRIVDTATGDSTPGRAVSASHAERFQQASYRGNARTLRLSAEQREAFDLNARARARDRARDALARQLAEKLSARIYADIVNRLP